MTRPVQFLAAAAGGMALAASVYFGAFYTQLGVAIPEPETHWIFESVQRKMESASKVSEGKLLLVGGSSVQFGFSACEMERQLGIPTVNFGTHAGLGLPYILHLTRHVVRPGDTVLLSLEYELYEHGEANRKDWATGTYLNYIVGRDAAWFFDQSVPEQLLLAMRLPITRLGEGLRNRFSPQPVPSINGFLLYDPRRLDARGDMRGHTRAQRGALDPKKLGRSEALLLGIPARAHGFAALQEFVAWCRARHVRVLATFPNLCRRREYEGPLPQEGIRAIQDFYANLGVPLLGEWQEAMLPPEAYFDTGYHLTEEGMAQRTREFLQAHAGCLQPSSQGPEFERGDRISWLGPAKAIERPAPGSEPGPGACPTLSKAGY